MGLLRGREIKRSKFSNLPTPRGGEGDSMRLVAVDFEAHQAECPVVSSVGNGHTAQSGPRGWNEVQGARAEPIAAGRGERGHEHTSVPAKSNVIALVAMMCAGLGAEK
jgi:hypothetical protein